MLWADCPLAALLPLSSPVSLSCCSWGWQWSANCSAKCVLAMLPCSRLCLLMVTRLRGFSFLDFCLFVTRRKKVPAKHPRSKSLAVTVTRRLPFSFSVSLSLSFCRPSSLVFCRFGKLFRLHGPLLGKVLPPPTPSRNFNCFEFFEFEVSLSLLSYSVL